MPADLSSSGNCLYVLDNGQWRRHPWPEVHARSENVAEWLLNNDVTAVGLTGEPTVELIAAILGAFQAGAAVSIAHGPVRGADSDHWAQTTLGRFVGMGISHILSHGAYLEMLSAAEGPLIVNELGSVARPQRSTTFVPPDGPCPGGDPAGHRGVDGSPDGRCSCRLMRCWPT